MHRKQQISVRFILLNLLLLLSSKVMSMLYFLIRLQNKHVPTQEHLPRLPQKQAPHGNELVTSERGV
jgi:hypothetical protein